MQFRKLPVAQIASKQSVMAKLGQVVDQGARKLAWAFAASSLAWAGHAVAQDAGPFPGKAVKIVIPFSAGGPSDGLGRLTAQHLSALWKVPVIVENKPGASGVIAAEYVRKSPADGYTMLLAGPASTTALVAVNPKVPYDPVRDFSHVSIAYSYPYVMAVNSNVASSLSEFLALAKANPGKYTYASSGVGTTTFMMAELLKSLAGVNLLHVPFPGVAPGVNAVMAGHVSLFFEPVSSAKTSLKSGKVTAVGVTTAKRVEDLANVPAIGEQVKGYDVDSWMGLFAPAGVPPQVLNRIASDFKAVTQSPAMMKALDDLGVRVMASTPEEMKTAVREDFTKWRRLVQMANLRSE